MGVEHLNGKRTGRRRGTKTTPGWVKALRWAERNLGKPDAVPPSDLAGRLVAMGREHPDRFVQCLALLDTPGRAAVPAYPQGLDPGGDADGGPRLVVATSVWAAWRASRVATLLLPMRFLYRLLRGERNLPAIQGVPGNAEIVGGAVEERGLVLTLCSSAFSEVPAGRAIPELEAKFVDPQPPAIAPQRPAAVPARPVEGVRQNGHFAHVKALEVPLLHLKRLLDGDEWLSMANIPGQYQIDNCVATEQGLRITIRSATFPAVQAGQVIPTLKAEFVSERFTSGGRVV